MTRVAAIHDAGNRLHQFESEWLSGSPPDLVAFLRDSSSGNPRYIGELIEIDLEYRWKGFSDLSDSAALDDRGFPRYPRLEDYAKLLPQALREQVLTPNLVAEEYRVRRRWGDRPDRQSYCLRFPDGQAELETALNCIDAEFATEEVDLAGAPRSLAQQSTITHGFSDSEPSCEGTEDPATPRQLGKYVLETLIGRGGFGEVWKARDAVLNRYVAVKTPRRDKHFTAVELLNFRSEAQKLSMLGRVPGIVTVYECGEHDGRPYIVSDFIEGESLQTRLDHGLLSFRETAEVVADVAETLNRMHLQGLVHRDVKPQNILLDSAGRPFVADFGMCVTEEEQLSEGHATVGTYAYMSPEQARGESQRTDGRADIYSLGVVLYRMLTGRLPFVGSQSSAYIDQVLHREPRPPRSINPDIPVELERITLKCLRKVVADRYTTAHDLAEDLRSFCGSAAGPAPQIESGRPLVEWMPGRRRAVVATVASIAVLIGGGVLIGKLWPAPEVGAGAGGETSLPATVPVPEAPPDDPVPVTIETEPPGARLVVHPVNYATGRLEPEKRTVVDGVTPAEIDLKPGDYLVVAYFDDGRFHEVYRHVPAPTETGLKLGFNHFFSRVENGRNLLPKIEIPEVDVTVGMSAIEGKPAFVLPPHYETEQLRKFSVPDFFVEQFEYTQGQRRNMLPEAHERNRDSHLVDGENFPLRSKYTFDKFVQIAEIEGKRLLTDLEFYYVATNGGATRFPSGNTIKPEAGTGITPVGVPDWDHTGHAKPVFGLCSGVAEWVDTQPLFHVPEHATEIMPVHRNYYVIKGGNDQTLLGIFDISEADRNPRTQIIRDRGTISPGLGCRFARSAGPRLKPEDFVTEWKE